MLSPVRTYNAAVELGHSLYTVHVVFFAPIPGVLNARVCGRLRLECLQAGRSGHLLLIGCLSPGFLLEARFKSLCLCHSLQFFSFPSRFIALLSQVHILQSAASCVFDASVFDGLNQNQQRAAPCYCSSAAILRKATVDHSILRRNAVEYAVLHQSQFILNYAAFKENIGTHQLSRVSH